MGRDPNAPPILGVISIYAYILCLRSTKFDVVTHVGRGVYLGVSHASNPKRADFQGFPIFFWFLRYLCLHPLTQNDEIRRGNIYGYIGPYFRRQATPLHLHKCVARFVNVSWISRSLKFSAVVSFPSWHRMVMPPPLGRGIKRWCASDVCLSVCRVHIGPKSTTERPRETKLDREVAHVSRDSDTTFKVKRTKVKVTGMRVYCGGLPLVVD